MQKRTNSAAFHLRRSRHQFSRAKIFPYKPLKNVLTNPNAPELLVAMIRLFQDKYVCSKTEVSLIIDVVAYCRLEYFMINLTAN